MRRRDHQAVGYGEYVLAMSPARREHRHLYVTGPSGTLTLERTWGGDEVIPSSGV